MRLIAPPHTPFRADGGLNLDVVSQQAEHFVRTGIAGVFVAGTTGEGQSLSVAERMALTEAWVEVGRAHQLSVIIQVGHNCHEDACYLARHAAESGADAVSASAPCFFRPANVTGLIDVCREVAAAADPLPFYFYDIPAMTNVRLPMVEFLQSARTEIGTFAGLKYTNPDLVQLQECLSEAGTELEVFFGCDEILLAGRMLGCDSAVGSTYNMAAEHNLQMIADLEAGRLEEARAKQRVSVEMIRVMQRYGFVAACKASMKLVGIDCGPVRLPVERLTTAQEKQLLQELEQLQVIEPAVSRGP